MGEKEISYGKQYKIWICLLAKRLWKQPVYIGLLVLIPLMGYVAGIMERGERSGTAVAVCVEDGEWRDEIIALLTEQEEDSVLRFEFCDDRDQVQRRVAGEEADCGFVIAEKIEEKAAGGSWRKAIEVYETASSSITGMAKERIAGVIFRLYSEERYMEYMGSISEEAAEYAMEAYETYLMDGRTFGFHYLYDDSYSQYKSDMGDGNDNVVSAAVFPVKGVFGVLIFIAGMCGMLEYEKDKKEKRFVRLAPNALTYLVDIWIATFFISVAVLVCLWISEGFRSCGDIFSPGRILTVWDAGVWMKQILNLAAYQCIVAGYCVILRVLLRRQELIAASIPILTLGSLVCAPVFIRLGTYLPVFAVLEKLFPVSYYLMMA